MLPLLFMYALSTFPLSKVALSYTNPLLLVGIRMTSAGILLLLYTAYNRTNKNLHPKYLSLYIKAIVCASFLPYALRYYGMQSTSLSGAYFLLQTGPLITYACNCLFNQEQISVQKICLLLLAFLSSILMMGTQFWFNGSAINLGFSITSLALLASVACFSYGWIVIKKLITTFDHHPITVNMVTMLGGGILALIATVCTNTSMEITEFKPFIMALIPIIIVSNLLVHTLYATLAKRYSLTLLALGCHLSPLFTALYQNILYHTPLTAHALFSGSALLAILFVFYKIESTEKYNYSTPKATYIK